MVECRCCITEFENSFLDFLADTDEQVRQDARLSSDEFLLDSIDPERIKEVFEDVDVFFQDDLELREKIKKCLRFRISEEREEAIRRGLIDDSLTKIVVVASVATAFGLLFAAFFTQK